MTEKLDIMTTTNASVSKYFQPPDEMSDSKFETIKVPPVATGSGSCLAPRLNCEFVKLVNGFYLRFEPIKRFIFYR